ncbi:MAG TPA: chorismate mutase, partial [Spirochaetia bacterium]|nr:chorismate mutase [Spirochaetia bacterium]
WTSIHDAATRLLSEVLEINAISRENIISIMFSVTEDLDAGNPATGVRKAGFTETPLFCVQEASVKGGMPRIIRALVTFDGPAGRKVTAVYLDGAESLRPDIAFGGGP